MSGSVAARVWRGRGRPRRGALTCAPVLIVIILVTLAGTPATSRADRTARLYVETGHTLAEPFLSYYDAHGGLALFGYPLTEATPQNGYLTQYFERERFEYHPELPEAYRVTLGLLGREQTALWLDQGPFQAAPSTISGYFAATQHRISANFQDYWTHNGGLAIFGYPISEAYLDNGFEVQWFERARFELHPELPPAYRVSLGLLGADALKVESGPQYSVGITDQPAVPRRLRFGVSQGGESYEPHFFANVIARGRDLQPRLVRIDNIYSHYNVVNFDAQGKMFYNWTGLDAVVSDIETMGAQPLMDLSYMPPALAAQPGAPGANVSPPRSYNQWQQLVYDTVYHYNIEQRRGIQYWEVWNEPNISEVWRGTQQDYYLLYDASQRGALTADPSIKIGGPALSQFAADTLEDFVYHCAMTKVRCDFVDWHSYGKPPSAVAADVQTMKGILARYPNVPMETMVSEWNVLQGGPNDTSINGRSDTPFAAANALATLDAMERAGLDWTLAFELKDGYRDGSEYWGRWGLLADGAGRKPIYHALQVYQQLNAARLYVDQPNADLAGAIAAPGDDGVPTVMAWYRAEEAGSLRLSIAPRWAKQRFDLYLIDATHANPAVSGDDEMRYVTSVTPDAAGGFSFKMTGAAVVILIPAKER
jgi:beta-xylosidase